MGKGQCEQGKKEKRCPRALEKLIRELECGLKIQLVLIRRREQGNIRASGEGHGHLCWFMWVYARTRWI